MMGTRGEETEMRNVFLTMLLVLALTLWAREPLANRIAHTDPSLASSRVVHGGAGNGYNVQSLLESGALDTNLYFLHRGTIPPKSGIGHHFHNQCEEMFIIFDGEAQFTVDGRTSLLKGPVGAPCRMGHSHAIYNPTDKPVQWMNINVSNRKGTYDTFDLGDSRSEVEHLDPIPTFITMRLDRALLRPLAEMNGGHGSVQYRRALDTTVFSGPWAYVDQVVLEPGSSIGPHYHAEVAEVYYIMSGTGSITVGAAGRGAQPETAKIRAGDAIPIQLNEIHSVENDGQAPLEIMMIGVSRDNRKQVDSVNAPAGRGMPRR
jgi:mannose-6-phosphate isomerase-like protein (cupin superfamily)